jgi:hypothetical protein
VRSTIEKLKGDISTHICQHAVVADPESILGVESVGIPSIDRGHRARIRSDKRRDREDSMAVIATARCQRGKHCVAQPGEYTSAFAAVVQGVLSESLCEPVTSGGSYCGDSEVGPEPLGIALNALMPLWRGIGELVDAGREGRARNGIWTESVEDVIAAHRSLSWTLISEIQLG